jgi:hypothetical protein
MDELSEKVAYFFHASLQGLEAAPHALEALQKVADGQVRQGLLADAQAFTLVQLLRSLKTQGKLLQFWVGPTGHELLRSLKTQGELPSLGGLFDFNLKVFSHELGVRKPSKTLFQTLVQRTKDAGISPGEILYVSSRLSQDLAVAKSLGLHTALYAGDKLSLRATKAEIGDPKLRPDRLLTDLAQIGELLPL